MIVPAERVSSSQKIKKYVGNDLSLSIFENKRNLIITGNNCKIKLSENSGQVRVVGDYCDVTVLNGTGTIEYIGNYGKVKLGFDISEDVVTYIGNGGEISPKYPVSKSRRADKHEISSHRERKINPNENHIDISNVSKIRYPAAFLLPNIKHIPIPNVRITKHKI